MTDFEKWKRRGERYLSDYDRYRTQAMVPCPLRKKDRQAREEKRRPIHLLKKGCLPLELTLETLIEKRLKPFVQKSRCVSIEFKQINGNRMLN